MQPDGARTPVAEATGTTVTTETAGAPPPGVGPRAASGARVTMVHRVAAAVVAVVIACFGAFGLAGGLGFFDTQGPSVAGLSTNGALSTVSIATAVVLVAAAVRGGRIASTTMVVVGSLFLVSAFANLAVLDTEYNLLAFRLPNVFFSIGAGMLLLFLGAYGRLAGNLPSDNPYHRDDGDGPGDGSDDASHAQPSPRTADEAAADRAMAEAERARTRGGGSDGQRRRLAATDDLRWHEDRRSRWMSLDDSGPPHP